MTVKEQLLVNQIERMNDMINLMDEQIEALERDLALLESIA